MRMSYPFWGCGFVGISCDFVCARVFRACTCFPPLSAAIVTAATEGCDRHASIFTFPYLVAHPQRHDHRQAPWSPPSPTPATPSRSPSTFCACSMRPRRCRRLHRQQQGRAAARWWCRRLVRKFVVDRRPHIDCMYAAVFGMRELTKSGQPFVPTHKHTHTHNVQTSYLLRSPPTPPPSKPPSSTSSAPTRSCASGRPSSSKTGA